MFSGRSFLHHAALLSIVLLSLSGTAAYAQFTQFSQVTSSKALQNGIELHDGAMTMRITALRADVLRIRASRTSELPEDASWAVLPESRTASISVTQDAENCCIGFHTASLRVSIERKTGLLTIRDGANQIIEQDAQPLTWTGTEFRLHKVMPADEHYFVYIGKLHTQ